MGQSNAPPSCLECDSGNVKPAQDKPDQFICSNCGLVMDKRDTSIVPENMKGFSDRLGEFVRADWSEQNRTAIVGLVKEPDRTYQEYYRIEDPREFFEGCTGEEEQLERIRESDLRPFETLDLPHLEWRFSTH